MHMGGVFRGGLIPKVQEGGCERLCVRITPCSAVIFVFWLAGVEDMGEVREWCYFLQVWEDIGSRCREGWIEECGYLRVKKQVL
jgi:hypothetical protein